MVFYESSPEIPNKHELHPEQDLINSPDSIKGNKINTNSLDLVHTFGRNLLLYLFYCTSVKNLRGGEQQIYLNLTQELLCTLNGSP